MQAALDSATPPTAAQVEAAKAAGYRQWNGYISTAPFDGRSHFNLARPWSQAEFEVARQCGNTPIAFASGWDNPVALKSLAAAWKVRLCLDDESGIRATGGWEQKWVSQAASGIYGNYWLHGVTAAFHILAAYPTSGDPTGASWWSGSSRPTTPCGWQWTGSHSLYGVTVDSEWLDDWFAEGGSEQVDVQVIKSLVTLGWLEIFGHFPTPAEADDFNNVVEWCGTNGEHSFDQIVGMLGNPKSGRK